MLLENMKNMVSLNDPISLIIRCHLITEALLDALIDLAFAPNGKAIISANLTYEKKLQIASKAMLDSDWPLLQDYVVGSLRKLNSLRNKTAHNLEAKVTHKEVIELFMGESHFIIDFTDESLDINMVIYHYTSFIFGNLLPKYESIEDK